MIKTIAEWHHKTQTTAFQSPRRAGGRGEAPSTVDEIAQPSNAPAFQRRSDAEAFLTPEAFHRRAQRPPGPARIRPCRMKPRGAVRGPKAPPLRKKVL